MPRSLRKNTAATLLGLSLVVVTASSLEGQATGRLQVSARVLSVEPQQEALTQARMALSLLLEGKQVFEARPRFGDGLIFLKVRRLDQIAGRHLPEAFAVAVLVYIAN